MIFFPSPDETHILRGTMERYITVYKGKELVLPCKPSNRNVTLNLHHTSAREVGTGHFFANPYQQNSYFALTWRIAV